MKEVERQETAWLRLAWQLGYEEGRPRAPVGRGEARALPGDRGRAGAPQDRRHRHDRDLHDPAVPRDYLARLMKMLPGPGDSPRPPSRDDILALRIPRKIKALRLLLAERATDRATERERKAQRYGRATDRAQRSRFLGRRRRPRPSPPR